MSYLDRVSRKRNRLRKDSSISGGENRLKNLPAELRAMIYKNLWNFAPEKIYSPGRSEGLFVVYCIGNWRNPFDGITGLKISGGLFKDIERLDKSHKNCSINIFDPETWFKIRNSGPFIFKKLDFVAEIHGPLWTFNLPILQAFGNHPGSKPGDYVLDIATSFARVEQTRINLLQLQDDPILEQPETWTRQDEETSFDQLEKSRVAQMTVLAAKFEARQARRQEMEDSRRFAEMNSMKIASTGRLRVERPTALSNENSIDSREDGTHSEKENTEELTLPRLNRFYENCLYFKSAAQAALFFEADLIRMYQIRRFWFFYQHQEEPSMQAWYDIKLVFRYISWARRRTPVYFSARFKHKDHFTEHACKITFGTKGKGQTIEDRRIQFDRYCTTRIGAVPLHVLSLDELPEDLTNPWANDVPIRRAEAYLRKTDFIPSLNPLNEMNPLSIEYDADKQALYDRYWTMIDIWRISRGLEAI